MSEMKCPVCQTGVLEDWDRKVRQCDSCDFRCNTEDLPRIAAAMELARAASNLHKFRTPQDYENVSEAKRRVIEVFGGE